MIAASPIDIPRRNLLPLLVQAAWLAISALLAIVLVARVRELLREAQTICVMPNCQPAQLTAAQLHWFNGLGLNPQYYGALIAVLFVGMNAVYWILAGAIIRRRPADPMALFSAFMLVIFVGTTIGSFTQTAPGLPGLVQTLTTILAWAGGSAIPVYLYIFPGGRFAPRWPVVFLIPWVVQIGFSEFVPDSALAGDQAAAIATVLAFAAVLGAHVYRFRRVSGPVERQQTKWVVYGIAAAIIGFQLATLLYSVPAMETNPLLPVITAALLFAFLLIIPSVITIAILRYHLYEIDVLINRTLVYGSLTLCLAALYIVCVVGLQALFRAVIGQSSDLAIAVSTLAVAAAFSPARLRLQRLIDRRFYRHKYDAARTLAALQTTLRNEIDLEALSDALVSVLYETVQPAVASVWLADEGR